MKPGSLGRFLILGLLIVSCQPLLSPTQLFVRTPVIAPKASVFAPPITTPTPIQLPPATAAAVPTQIEKTPTAVPIITGTVIAMSKPRVYSLQVSPDGKWLAKVIIYDCVQVSETDENAYEQLKIIRSADGVEQVVDDQLQYCGGLGTFGFKGLFWSPNSRYFYYTDAREGTPDGLCSYWEPPIRSFDVTAQKKEYVGDGPRSPDRTKIAAWQNQGLVMWDINTGEIGRISVAGSGQVAGPIAWSPDSRAIVYVRTINYCPPRGRSIVGRIDLPGLQHTILLKPETPSFESLEWNTPAQLRLFDEASKKWQYDFGTKQLKQLP